MTISDNLLKIKSALPESVTLIAVSKTHPATVVEQAYAAGQRVFGENKVQEMCEKAQNLPEDIQWHLIGHLQTNKVKYIAPFVSLIHSVDSLKLLKEIDKQGAKNNRIIPCLLQFHIAEEDTKFGLNEQEARDILNSEEYKSLNHIELRGVMGMATFTDDENQIAREFANLRNIFETLKADFFPSQPSFKEISMGMSSDYHLAIGQGSTLIRVGSSIFGHRDYP